MVTTRTRCVDLAMAQLAAVEVHPAGRALADGAVDRELLLLDIGGLGVEIEV